MFSFLLGLLLIFLFVVAIAAAVKWIWGQKIPPWASKNKESALDILKQRYARGEVSKEEFERIKKDIE